METTTKVASKPSRVRGLIGMFVSVLLAGAGIALLAFSQVLPAALALGIAVVCAMTSGTSLWTAKHSDEGARDA
jgi:hypothetical protein